MQKKHTWWTSKSALTYLVFAAWIWISSKYIILILNLPPMIHSILILLSKGTLSTWIFYIPGLFLQHYIEQSIFFLKDENEALNRSNQVNIQDLDKNREHLHSNMCIWYWYIIRISHLKIMQNYLTWIFTNYLSGNCGDMAYDSLFTNNRLFYLEHTY